MSYRTINLSDASFAEKATISLEMDKQIEAINQGKPRGLKISIDNRDFTIKKGRPNIPRENKEVEKAIDLLGKLNDCPSVHRLNLGLSSLSCHYRFSKEDKVSLLLALKDNKTLTSLELDHNFLSSFSAEELQGLLSHLKDTNIAHLTLDNEYVQSSTLQEYTNVFPAFKHSKVTHIELKYTNFQRIGNNSFFHGLEGTSIESLAFANVYRDYSLSSYADKDARGSIETFFQDFSKSPLKELDLSGHALGKCRADALSRAMSSIFESESLVSLNLAENDLGSTDYSNEAGVYIEKFSGLFLHLKKSKIKRLNLASNHIFEAFEKEGRKTCHYITLFNNLIGSDVEDLDLSGNFAIELYSGSHWFHSEEEMRDSLSYFAILADTKVKKLNLSSFTFRNQNYDRWRHLIYHLKETHIEYLGMADSGLHHVGDEDLAKIFFAFKDIPVETLDISNNHFSQEQLPIVFSSLAESNVETLILEGELPNFSENLASGNPFAQLKNSKVSALQVSLSFLSDMDETSLNAFAQCLNEETNVRKIHIPKTTQHDVLERITACLSLHNITLYMNGIKYQPPEEVSEQKAKDMDALEEENETLRLRDGEQVQRIQALEAQLAELQQGHEMQVQQMEEESGTLRSQVEEQSQQIQQLEEQLAGSQQRYEEQVQQMELLEAEKLDLERSTQQRGRVTDNYAGQTVFGAHDAPKVVQDEPEKLRKPPSQIIPCHPQ